MRRSIIALVFLLAACTATGTVTPESVVAWLKTNCGVAVQLIDIAALLAANPTVTVVAQIGDQVCTAVKAQRAEQLKAAEAGNKAVPSEGVVTVGGVPIHYKVGG